jgi:hypothetical protein
MLKRLAICISCLVFCGIGYGQDRPITHAEHGSAINSDYVGLEKMENVSPDDPAARWFHENRLLVRNNEAILEKVPIIIEHRQKTFPHPMVDS